MDTRHRDTQNNCSEQQLFEEATLHRSLAKQVEKSEEKMSTMKVEVYKTLLTPKGRRFPPREPRRFELTLGADTESSLSTLRDEVTRGFPGMKGNFTILYKDVNDQLLPCNTDWLKAVESDQSTLKLYVQPKGPLVRKHDVKCSNCRQDIVGTRIKCLECPEFDLCDICDAQGEHSQHVKVKCDRPWFYNNGLPKFMSAVPQLCQELKASGEPTPAKKITPQEIRKFYQKLNQKPKDNQPKEKKEIGTPNPSADGKWPEMVNTMKQTWREFLVQTVDEEKVQKENNDGKNASKNPTNKKGAKKIEVNKEKLEALQPLKKQWMQDRNKDWRQHLIKAIRRTNKGTAEPKKNPVSQIWRPFMRRSWDHWQDLTREPESQSPADPGPNRRRWIESCLELWRAESAALVKEHFTEGDAAKESKKNANCPFPGYHFLMAKSWRLLVASQINAEKQSEILKPKDAVEMKKVDEKAKNDDRPRIAPEMAKQMLKVCWIDGCRRIWWSQAKDSLDVPAPASASEKPTLTQGDLLAKMFQKSQWRNYMLQTWRLWKQMTNQSGFGVPQPEQQKPEYLKDGAEEEFVLLDRPDQATPPKPKQWLEGCWTLWEENKPKAEERNSRAPMWDKQPFPGWRQLTVQGWRAILKELGQDAMPAKERREQILNKRQIWMKQIKKELAACEKAKEATISDSQHNTENGHDLDLKKVDDSPKQKKPGNQKTTVPAIQTTSVPENWEKLVELRKILMKQYWQMWSKREAHPGQGHRGQGCPGRRGCAGRRHGGGQRGKQQTTADTSGSDTDAAGADAGLKSATNN